MAQGDENCIVFAHWTGGQFKILDINGVGQMDPANVVVLKDVPVQAWPTGNSPSKELLISTLKVFLHRIENRHYKTLRSKVYVPENFRMSQLRDSLERGELSAEGIEVLASKGQFGKEVFPKLRVQILAKRVQVPPEECYGFVAKVGLEQGEVLAHWVNDHFKLLRTDDVGKLPAALEAVKLSASSPAAVKEMPQPKVMPAAEPPKEKLDPATACLLYTSPSPRDGLLSRMPSSA